jgi:hypothetical protein
MKDKKNKKRGLNPSFSFDMLINHKSVFQALLELMLLEEKSLV